MRPYWVPHVRIAFGGTFGTPNVLESWSNTIRYMESGGLAPTRDQLNAWNNAAWENLVTWFTSPEAMIGGGTRLTWIKTNFILQTGKQRDVNTVLREEPGGPMVGGDSPPWSQTYVLTHRTGLKRGRAHSGRIFPPAVRAVPAGGTPYISTANADGMATVWAAALRAMAASGNGAVVGSDWYPAVISPGDLDKPAPASESKFQKITGVVCDRVPDVMHSRTRQVPRNEGALKPIVP